MHHKSKCEVQNQGQLRLVLLSTKSRDTKKRVDVDLTHKAALRKIYKKQINKMYKKYLHSKVENS